MSTELWWEPAGERQGNSWSISMDAENRLTDDEAHDLAVRHLASVLGSNRLPEIAWDVDHHLQGHLDVAGHHMVLIATRTRDRSPLFLTDEDWDSLRRTHCHAAA
jgi:hypothetical protein